MSKKTKKTQITEHQEVIDQTTEENNEMETTNNMAYETTPTTIVEGTEAEVFSGQTECQESKAPEAETQVVEGPVAETEGEIQPAEQTGQPEQPEEKPAPKPRVNKRPYIALVTQHLEAGDMDRKELATLVMNQFPTVKKGSIETFLTDCLNPRYSFFKDRVVIKHAGKMVFADLVETQPKSESAEVVTEVPVQEEQPEQSAE